MVSGSTISRANVLVDATLDSNLVEHGPNYTLPSVLQETKTWLADKKGSLDWVDLDMVHMAQASLEGNTSFEYIVSDNIAHKYPHDLSNERLRQVCQESVYSG
jgi:hypothetical protein